MGFICKDDILIYRLSMKQNYDILEKALNSLEFAQLVYTVKYEDGQMDAEKLKRFFEAYTSKLVGFDFGKWL